MDNQDYRELVKQVAYEQAKLSTSAFFFDGQDRLRIRSFGSVTSCVLAVEGRFLGADGRLQGFARVHTPTTDRTLATTSEDFGEGFLLNVQVRATTSAPRVGQVFVILDVVRGLGATIQPIASLWSGYVTDTTPLGWPGVLPARSVDGPGVLRLIAGTDPAAGVEIIETVPTNARWRVLGVRFALTTDATVANREVSLTLDDGATAFNRIASRVTQAASLTIIYSASLQAALEAVAQDTERLIRLPPVLMSGGFRFRTQTTAIVAGDNYTAPQYLVEEWIED